MPSHAVVTSSRFRHTARHRFGHRHPDGQLFLLHRGFAQLETVSGKAGVSAAWLGWIPADIDHEVTSAGPVCGISFRIEPRMAQAFPAATTIVPASELMRQLLQRIATVDEAEHQSNLLRVLADEVAAAPADAGWQHTGVVAALIGALDADPASRQPLAHWASVLGTTERTLARRLRQETGKSFIEWRTELRVAKACELLAFGASVTEVSLVVGYDSPSAFARSFHRATGRLPGEFAKA